MRRTPYAVLLTEEEEREIRAAAKAAGTYRRASAPTIEEVALALGEQYAHLAPYQTHDQPDGPGTDLVPAVWWAVHRWEEDELRRPVLAPVRWTDDDGHDHALAGPTREDALVAAGEAIRAGRFDPVTTGGAH